MKDNVTYIDSAKFEAIYKELGLEPRDQAGFTKLSGAKGRNVYVARTKRVGRVDLSGFEMLDAEGKATPGVVALGGASFGAVKQQLDFSLTEPEVLANFRAVLEHMKSLPEREIVRANPVSGKKRPEAEAKPREVPGLRKLTPEDIEKAKAEIMARRSGKGRAQAAAPEAAAPADKA